MEGHCGGAGRRVPSDDVSFDAISTRFDVVVACCVAVLLSCTTVLACLADVASRNSLARVNSSGTLPIHARSLSAIADERVEESESSMSSLISSATERMAAAASAGSLGRRETVSRILIILDLLYCLPVRTQPFLLSQERASARDLTGLLLPEISAMRPDREGRSCDGVGVPVELALHGVLLVRVQLLLSLSSIGGGERAAGGGGKMRHRWWGGVGEAGRDN
jgi:hypothetical protein